MQDIFISPLSGGLASWIEAFAKAKIAITVNAKPTKIQKSMPLIFWLHMNEDRQEWLVNTIHLIQKKYERAKIVVLANAPNQAEAFHAMSLGVVAYAHAYSPAFVLTEMKTVISHGGVWIGQDLLKRIIEVSTSLAGNQLEQVNQRST